MPVKPGQTRPETCAKTAAEKPGSRTLSNVNLAGG
jgi:hypothetical protein